MNQNPIIPIIINYLKFNYELEYNHMYSVCPDLIEKPDKNKRSFGSISREIRKIFSVTDKVCFTAFDGYMIEQRDTLKKVV